MLAPGDRTLLFDALRPPFGYQLDRVVGTTYSLDLVALLTIPMAFTYFDWEDASGRPTRDPLALLEAVRRHADRIHVFCDAERIVVPKASERVLGFLEKVVIPAQAVHPEGAFHPKTWTLRFRSDEGPVRYRFVCLSRNVTFDRSWDTAVVLDGALVNRKPAFAGLHPLGDFLKSLPGRAVVEIPATVRDAVDQIAWEIRRVKFDPPRGVDRVLFHPIGIDGRRDPIPKNRRDLLVISPFLSEQRVSTLRKKRPRFLLVSRQDQLDALPSAVAEAPDVSVLDPHEPVLEAEAEAHGEPANGSAELDGLHAKVFVMDDGWSASVFLGSANATEAAFRRNVEFLVELRGKKSDIGIDAVLGEDKGGVRSLLRPYRRNQPAARDPLEIAAEARIRAIRRSIARAPLRMRVVPRDGGKYDLVLEATAGFAVVTTGLRIRVWPFTLGIESARELVSRTGELARWVERVLPDITAFLGVEIACPPAKSQRFALHLPLDGAPDDRERKLLCHLLSNKGDVLRLLTLLLAPEDLSVGDFARSAVERTRDPAGSDGGSVPLPLLESLLETMTRSPERLAAIHQLIEDLRGTDDGRNLLPPRFEEIWEPVWRAHTEVRE